ncbi:hypothetical protein [Streptomyces sp. NPDC005989]
MRDHIDGRAERAGVVRKALAVRLPGLLPHVERITDYFALHRGLAR